MIKNYFITAIRNIKRNFSFSILNIVGLVLGISSCLIIFLVVKYELGYDNFHKKADRIYRVNFHREDYNPSVSMGIVNPLRNDFPELEQVCLIWPRSSGLIKIGQNRLQEEKYAFVDEHFTNVFDYDWLAGNSRTALLEPNAIVLTKSIADKYFGQKDPMGQLITLDNQYHLKVTGLIKDSPGNTNLPFNFLVSFNTLKKELGEEMYRFYTIVGGAVYIVIPENYSIKKLESRLSGFVAKNWGKEIAKENELVLQPLKEIHFDQRYLSNSINTTTSKEMYWALSAVALLIIVMACINFINLSTAQSIKRAKEVGIRKALGGSRNQLIFQFMGETTLLVFLAVGFSLITSIWFIPEASKWLEIKINFNQFKEPIIIVWIIVITFFIIILAGLYPAFIQSSFNPINSLKNKVGIASGALTLRKGLVFLQFVVSQMLIVATLIVGFQMNFLLNQDLGFNKESVISFELPDLKKQELLKQQLSKNPGIKEISFSSGAPSYNSNYCPIHSVDLGIIKDEVSEIRFVDEKFTEMFELKLLAGEKLVASYDNQNMFADTNAYNPIIINEVLLHKLGIQDPEKAIGKHVKIYWNYNAIVTGVVKDFQSESKHKERRPCILGYSSNRFSSVSVKLNSTGINQTVEQIEKTWTKLFPDDIFNYEFMDEHLAAIYGKEEKEYSAFKLFSFIAILIGSLGLYGLISFAAVQRTKEIGIRKVLGATISQIVKLLSKDFLILLLLASFIAFPLSWYFMNKWLQNFAYHISITWQIFIIAGLASLVIALLTVSQQAIKAAVANPTKSLRSE